LTNEDFAAAPDKRRKKNETGKIKKERELETRSFFILRSATGAF